MTCTCRLLRHAAHAVYVNRLRSDGTGTGGGEDGADGPYVGCVGEAQKLALAFWQALVREERISGGIRELAWGMR